MKYWDSARGHDLFGSWTQPTAEGEEEEDDEKEEQAATPKMMMPTPIVPRTAPMTGAVKFTGGSSSEGALDAVVGRSAAQGTDWGCRRQYSSSVSPAWHASHSSVGSTQHASVVVVGVVGVVGLVVGDAVVVGIHCIEELADHARALVLRSAPRGAIRF